MILPSQLTLFLAAALALLLVPGPAVLYIVARSIHQGRSAGLVSMLGIETANLIHAMAASLGLSAILLSSAMAYDITKYLGAAYLIYLGLRKLLMREEDPQQVSAPPESLRRIYSQGLLVNLLNPKTALFFFAFLPQFVDRTRGSSVALQIFVLGILFVSMAVLTDSGYALLASSLAQRLKHSRGFLRAQRFVAGFVYLGLGITTALSGDESREARGESRYGPAF